MRTIDVIGRLIVCIVLLVGASCGQDRTADKLAGVNRPNLAWEPDWPSIIDDMNRGGVKRVRFTLVDPASVTAQTIAEANKDGISVLLNVLLSMEQFYEPSVLPRAGNRHLRAVRGLSALDLDRFEIYLDRFLGDLVRRNARIDALELGNEINWADFNGDLPTVSEGRIFSTQEQLRKYAPRVIEGFRRYGEAVRITEKLLRKHGYEKVQLITGGLTLDNLPFIQTSGGSALTLSLVAQLYRKFDVVKFVSGVGVHVYPDVQGPAGPRGAIRLDLDYAAKFCLVLGRPCHITEWGIQRDGKCSESPNRAEEFRVFRNEARSFGFATAYVFDWDVNTYFRIFRCGNLVDFGSANFD